MGDLFGRATQLNRGLVLSEYQRVIATRMPSLNNPGAVSLDGLYHAPTDSSVDLIECQRQYGIQVRSVNDKGWGVNINFTTIKQGFSDIMFWEVVLPDFGIDLPAGTRVSISQGWALRSIRNIQFTFPDTNHPSVTIAGESLLPWMLSQCSTFSQRSTIMNMLGDSLDFVGGETGKYTVKQRTALVPLFMPWLDIDPRSRVPFDFGALSIPIDITVQTNDLRLWAQGSGVSVYAKNDFESIQIQNHALELSDESKGAGKLLRQAAASSNIQGLIYYPFLFPVSIQRLQGSSNNEVGVPKEVTFSLPISVTGDLVQLDLMFIDGKDLQVNAGKLRGQSLLGVEVLEVEVQLNSQPLYKMKDPKREMMPIFGYAPEQYIEAKANPSEWGTANPLGSKFAIDEVESVIYPIVFALKVPNFDPSKIQNTKSFAGQTLDIVVSLSDAAAQSYTYGLMMQAVSYYPSALACDGYNNKIYIGSSN